MEQADLPASERQGARDVVPRRWQNFIVDVVGLVDLAGLLATGIIIRWVLPHGGGPHRHGWAGLWGAERPRAREFLGLHRHDWGDIHTYLALAFIGLVALHVILHWRWVVAMCKRLAAPDG